MENENPLPGSFKQQATSLETYSVLESPFRRDSDRQQGIGFFDTPETGGDAFYIASMRLVLFSSVVSLAYFGGDQTWSPAQGKHPPWSLSFLVSSRLHAHWSVVRVRSW